MDSNDFKIVKFGSKMSSKLVDDLIKNSNDEYWWTNWDDNYQNAIKEFKKISLTGIFGEDIQTLWYDLYKDDEEYFCKIVSKYVDGMFINQDGGWEDLYVIYNIPKVNKLMKHINLKEFNFNIIYNNYLRILLEVSKENINKIKNKIKSFEFNLKKYDDLYKINIDDVITMEYEVGDNEVYIEYIGVKKDYRKYGLAKLMLQNFLRSVDKKKMPVTLMVYPTDDVSENDLVNIYKKFGFRVYGKDKGNKRPLMKRESK